MYKERCPITFYSKLRHPRDDLGECGRICGEKLGSNAERRGVDVTLRINADQVRLTWFRCLALFFPRMAYVMDIVDPIAKKRLIAG